MKAIGLSVALTLITGCTNTASNLMADPKSYEGSMQANVTAQAAYRNLREATRQCLESSPMGTPVTVEGEFDSEIREGQIIQRMIAQGVRLNLSIIAIKPKTELTTEVTLYTLKGIGAVGTRRPTMEKVGKWVAGDKTC